MIKKSHSTSQSDKRHTASNDQNLLFRRGGAQSKFVQAHHINCVMLGCHANVVVTENDPFCRPSDKDRTGRERRGSEVF